MQVGFKKTWVVRSYPDAVLRLVKLMPRIYDSAFEDGVVGWVGRTFSHQRKDFRPKPPRLTLEKEQHLVFQHDLVTPFTYTVDLQAEGSGTRVTFEVKTLGTSKDLSSAEQALIVVYALTKALEP